MACYYDSMKWSGKVFGGVLGAFVGGPIGAALGALAGHAYDEQGGSSGAGARGRDRPTSAQVADRFFRSTFEVIGHVAKADGRVSEREIDAARAIMREFQLNQAQVSAAIECFSRGKRADFDLRESMAGLLAACTDRPDLLRIFLEIQLRAALLGTDLQGPSRPLLQRIAAALGVGGIEFAHLEAVLRLRQGSARTRAADAAADAARLAEAYEVLEVVAEASDDDVVKAYRRQLSRHHPDKLKANGLPESMLEHAKQRTQQIIEAWELIRTRRGLK
jgi:DnaJ like chaperone protein